MRLQLTGGALPIAVASALLGSLSTAAAVGQARLASDVLVYTDTDSVVVFSPQVTAHRELDDDGGEVTARAVVDAVTAASVDVISNATYRFSEVRTELSTSLSKRIGQSLPTASYRWSSEPDYQSHGLGLGWRRRLAGGDAVASARYQLTLDRIGRVDTPPSRFSESLHSHAFEVGLTQTLDTSTLVRVVYTLTAQFGYMEKPYRSVPLFDSAGLARAEADGVALTLDTFEAYRLSARPPEEVPDDRFRHALAVRGLRYVDRLDGALRLDYRFYGDSWGVLGHTLEPAFARALSDHYQLDLWSRLHVQSSARFWQRAHLVASPTSLPRWRTMDRSLSRSWHTTFGARLGYARGAWVAYGEVSAMYSRFLEHLLIDRRLAIISQFGVRWSL